MKYSKGLKFVSYEDGTCCVTDLGICTDLDVIIPPKSPEGDRVTSIDDFAFKYRSYLTSITIPNSVTNIGNYAFYDCTAEIVWGNDPSIVIIGRYAFSNYRGTSITIPKSVTSIGYAAFDCCTKLTSITIPDSVMSIGYAAFAGCSSLTSVTLGKGLTSIGDSVFYECSSLESITITGKVTSIKDGAFYNCSSLTSITIPDGVTSIRQSVFNGCTKLTSVTIPDGVTSIGESAFGGCTNLTSRKSNYKAFKIGRKNLLCRGLVFHEDKKTEVKGKLVLCANGIHYCTNLYEIFDYYYGEIDKDIAIYECEVSEENIGEVWTSKRCARWIIPKKRLWHEDVIRILNGG